MSYFKELNQKAHELHRGRFRDHPAKFRLQYDHQEMCKRVLEKGEITQEEYGYIIRTMGGKVIKI